MSDSLEAQKKKIDEEAKAAFQRITDKLATIDGIATADAVELGMLIQEYGTCMGNVRMATVLMPIMGIVGLGPRKDPDASEPWRKTGG